MKASDGRLRQARQHRLWSALLCSVAVTACATTVPTPKGSVVLKAVLSKAQGAPPTELEGSPVRYVQRARVAADAVEIEVHLDTVEAGGGKYLRQVEVLLLDAAGGEVTGAAPEGAKAWNRGTVDRPVAALPLVITWQQRRACSHVSRTNVVEIGADGSVRVK